MKRNIFITSILIFILLTSTVVGTSTAYLSDTEKSIGNTLTAGTIDLTINNINTNIANIELDYMNRCKHESETFILKNIGTVNGYLDITNVTFLDPKRETCSSADSADTSNKINLRLFVDNDKDNTWDGAPTDELLYEGKLNELPLNQNLDKIINAGQEITLETYFDWNNNWDCTNCENHNSAPEETDNDSQTHSLFITIEFCLKAFA